MPSTGYIDSSGVYHKAVRVPLQQLNKVRQSTYQQSDWARQRFDHSAEIIQPYTVDGKPNPEFIEINPDAAEQYGFTPKTTPVGPKTSDTPNPGDKGYGGSTPWEFSRQLLSGSQ